MINLINENNNLKVSLLLKSNFSYMLKLRVLYRIIFSLLFCALISCDDELTEEIIEQEITTKPVISISKNLSYIETETNFIVSIESEFNVQTELARNNIKKLKNS